MNDVDNSIVVDAMLRKETITFFGGDNRAAGNRSVPYRSTEGFDLINEEISRLAHSLRPDLDWQESSVWQWIASFLTREKIDRENPGAYAAKILLGLDLDSPRMEDPIPEHPLGKTLAEERRTQMSSSSQATFEESITLRRIYIAPLFGATSGTNLSASNSESAASRRLVDAFWGEFAVYFSENYALLEYERPRVRGIELARRIVGPVVLAGILGAAVLLVVLVSTTTTIPQKTSHTPFPLCCEDYPSFEVNSGKSMPESPEGQAGVPGDRFALNADQYNPRIGLESKFSRIGRVGGTIESARNIVLAHPGDELRVYLYFANSSASAISDVRMYSDFTTKSIGPDRVRSEIFVKDRAAGLRWSEYGIVFANDGDHEDIEVIPGSAQISIEGGITAPVDETDIFSSDGVLLDCGDGSLSLGCRGYVSYDLRVVAPDVEIETSVRLDGTERYRTSVGVGRGDRIDVQIEYTNVSDRSQEGVTVGFPGLRGLTYVPGSTTIRSIGDMVGISAKDIVNAYTSSNAVLLPPVGPGETVIVNFQAIGTPGEAAPGIGDSGTWVTKEFVFVRGGDLEIAQNPVTFFEISDYF